MSKKLDPIVKEEIIQMIKKESFNLHSEFMVLLDAKCQEILGNFEGRVLLLNDKEVNATAMVHLMLLNQFLNRVQGINS